MTGPTQSVHDPDDELAEFTDRLLNGEPMTLSPSTSEEVRLLEESVLRLHRAFPMEPLDPKARERLQASFVKQARDSERRRPGVSWWSQHAGQRVGWGLALVAVVVLIVFAPGLLTSIGNDVQGTAGLPSHSVAPVIVLGGVLIFLIWLGRRK